MTCGPSCLPWHSMLSLCTLEIYLCTLDCLELHWVQGGPIVTLARLFLFQFTPNYNWPNIWPMKIGPKHGPRKWPKYKSKIKPILLYTMVIKLEKNGRADNNYFSLRREFSELLFLLPIFLAKCFEFEWVFIIVVGNIV